MESVTALPDRRVVNNLNIVVLIRNAVDCRVPLPPDVYGERPVPEGMVSIINPADWGALEQALNLREQEGVEKVMAMSLGGPEAEEALRWCLAAGVQRVLRIWDQALADADLLGRGRALAAALSKAKPDLVMCGDGCPDQLNSALPGMIAAAAGMAYVPGVTGLEKPADGKATVIRRLEKGKRERVVVRLPAVVAIEDGGGEPAYYAGLPGSISAFTAAVPCKGLACLGLSAERAGSRGAKVHNTALRVARPVVTRPATPDPGLPAEQRLRKILTAGMVRKQGEVITGSAEQLADRIVDFLRQEPVVRL